MVRKAVRGCAGVILFAAITAALSACSPNQPPSTTAGTTPPIWTGSPAPTGTLGQPAGPEETDSLTAHLSSPDGIEIAIAKFEFDQDYVRITVTTTEAGQLPPGFHGLHIHSVGKCEADSVAPAGGAPGDFNSAGGHFQVSGRTAHPASGDLTSLEVRDDGDALLVTTTSAFTKKDLLAGNKTSIIIHADADNFDNIPPARYTQTDGVPGPDEITTTTGDAGKRLACGVIGAG